MVPRRKKYLAYDCEQNDAAAPGMNKALVNKTCFVCEMQSPSSIVTNDLDLNFAVTALHKSDTCICTTCLAEPMPYDTDKSTFKTSKSSKEKEY